MADASLSERPAFGTLLRPVGMAATAIAVEERAGLGLATVQARPGRTGELRARVRALFGLDLPDAPRRAAAGDVAFLGTGPGAWLAVRDGAADGLARGLAADLAGLASVADQSDGYGVLRLAGDRVPDALRKGMTVDLHPAVFRPGDVAVTTAAHVGVTLWRLPDGADGRPCYEVACFRSYAGSFWRWLSESAAEFGLRVAPEPRHNRGSPERSP